MSKQAVVWVVEYRTVKGWKIASSSFQDCRADGRSWLKRMRLLFPDGTPMRLAKYTREAA